jgi:hypothetical protein
VPEDAYWRKQPAHFQPEAKRFVSPKDPQAATANAKLAILIAEVEKAELTATAQEEAFVSPLKPKRTQQPKAPKAVMGGEFYALWLAKNPGLSGSINRRYKQVVAHLAAFQADWAVSTLTRKYYLTYIVHVVRLSLVDSITIKHVKFLRECFRLAGLPVPSSLKMQVRYGRSLALQAAELSQLIALTLFEQPALEQGRDLFL